MDELLQPWTGPVAPIVPPHLVFDAVERAEESRGRSPEIASENRDTLPDADNA